MRMKFKQIQEDVRKDVELSDQSPPILLDNYTWCNAVLALEKTEGYNVRMNHIA